MTLATGSALNAEAWADFVDRLRYHCNGAGVADHCTANAIFIVEARRLAYGIDLDYTDNKVVIVSSDEAAWFSPKEYWTDLDRTTKAKLNQLMQEHASCQFMKAREHQQWEVLAELDEHIVTGWSERWEYVNAHFTREAAEAFIKRKSHDYPKGLRVMVDAQVYCWEFEAVKAGILSGQIAFTGQQMVSP